MRSRVLPALMAGLGLLPAVRVTAQNYKAWPVTQIAAGAYHTLFTKSDGSLWVMGDNSYGQLGLGPTPAMTNVPQRIVSSGVVLLAAGFHHSLYKKSDISLWGMGTNGSGQLGLGAAVASATVPQQITSGVGLIAAGYNHSLFTGGSPPRLWVMGDNSSGQLGDGTYNNHYVPEYVFITTGTRAGFTAIAAGGNHSLFGTVNSSGGALWGMGYNGNGQLQLGSSTNKPELILSSGVAAVAAGAFHSLYIRESDGFLLSMGDDSFGQLGDGEDNYSFINVGPFGVAPQYPATNTVVAVAAGYYHSLFILSDGSLWAVGDDESGQLGNGAGGTHLWTDTPEMIVASNVVAVAAGGVHSLFIKSDGSLWGMGYNGNGQLGTGDYTERDTPVEIVAPPPQISIIPYGSNVILAWPTNAVGFILQSTTNLTPPVVWSTNSPAPVLIGNQFEVFTPSSGTQKFYRLMLSQ